MALVGRVFGAAVDYAKHGSDWEQDMCKDGDYQSPIDLKSDLANVYYEDDKFFKHYEDMDATHDAETYKTTWSADEFTTETKFKTTILAPEVSKWRPNYFTSNWQNLTSEWKAENFKFHSKSEHTFDGVRYDLEMQMFHEPEETENGYTAAIVSILFDAQRYDESVTAGQVEVIDTFFDNVQWSALDIDTTGTAVTEKDLTTVAIGQLMNIISTDNRYVYTGSFTTPPCTEKVYWNVINKVYPIKEKHLNTFRYL